MIETNFGLIEVCAKSSFYGNNDKLNNMENFLRYQWRIRYNEKQDA